MRQIGALIAAVVLLTQLSQSVQVRLLDEASLEAAHQVRSVARALCGEQKQERPVAISRFSTVALLVDHLQHKLPTASALTKLAKCYRSNLDFLLGLRELIDLSRGNVCSPEKINKLQAIHRKYISSRDQEDSHEQDHRQHISQALSLFFVHYAYEVAFTCRRSLENELQQNQQVKLITQDELMDDDPLSAGQLLAKLYKQFSWFRAPDSLEDVLLMWELLDGSKDDDDDTKPEGEKDKPTTGGQTGGEQARLFVKIRHAQSMNLFQSKCKHKFKPIYEQLILPSVRLANLGYATGDLAENTKTNKPGEEAQLLRRQWFGLTQICEIILPIRFVPDRRMSSDQMMLIKRREAEQMESYRSLDGPGFSYLTPAFFPSQEGQNNWQQVEELWSIKRADVRDLIVEKMKLNRKAGEEARERLLEGLSGNLFEFLARHRKGLVVSTGESSKQQVDLGQKLQQRRLEQMNETELVELSRTIEPDDDDDDQQPEASRPAWLRSVRWAVQKFAERRGDQQGQQQQQQGEQTPEDGHQKEEKHKESLMQKIQRNVNLYKAKVDGFFDRFRVRGKFKRRLLKIMLAFFGIMAVINIIICAIILWFLKG